MNRVYDQSTNFVTDTVVAQPISKQSCANVTGRTLELPYLGTFLCSLVQFAVEAAARSGPSRRGAVSCRGPRPGGAGGLEEALKRASGGLRPPCDVSACCQAPHSCMSVSL